MIYRQDFYNLQTRKKSEMVQTVQIEFSVSGNTTLTLDMIIIVLYKQLNCVADKTIDTSHTASSECAY